jgi:hypothetical protein
MIVLKDNERLYLTNWEYNMCRLMTKLAQVVENHGGRVKYGHPAMVSDRNIEGDEPIQVTHTSYITFILDDMYYYYQMDDNPFFPFYRQKTPIKDGKRSKDAYLEEDAKEWQYDCFFTKNCSEADITEGANLIFNMLCAAEKSGISREYTQERVSNSYNDGYHYEKIPKPERFETIDW